MTMTVDPFLMFEGQAEAAMMFYVALIPDSRVVSVERYAAGEVGKKGTIKLAVFELSGLRVRCTDSPISHHFTFTPSISLFLTVDDVQQVDDLAAKLGADGQAMMPPDDYGFSQRFAWVQDRFGVSWQINCP